jgi:GNAT superfamily N-acetyltransferase
MSDGPAFTVRPAAPADAGTLAAVHLDSISGLGARGYTAEQVAAWRAPCNPQRYVENMARGERFFLAFGGGGRPEPLGFSSYRVEAGRHRIATYVVSSGARSGVGTALFRAAEDLARACGAPEIHVDASVVSVEFYLSLGFVELGRGVHPMRAGGELACVFMRKTL